jgi:hypothetical protein
MATVRISGNWRGKGKMEWAGAPELDKETGQIDRTIELPEEAFLMIEAAIAKGHREGTIYLKSGVRFDYFVDM